MINCTDSCKTWRKREREVETRGGRGYVAEASQQVHERVDAAGLCEGVEEEEEENNELAEARRRFDATLEQVDLTPHQNDTELGLFAKKIIQCNGEQTTSTTPKNYQEIVRILEVDLPPLALPSPSGSFARQADYKAHCSVDFSKLLTQDYLLNKGGKDEAEEAKAVRRARRVLILMTARAGGPEGARRGRERKGTGS
eukprot:764504-Hanusia_phi.AAC.5